MFHNDFTGWSDTTGCQINSKSIYSFLFSFLLGGGGFQQKSNNCISWYWWSQSTDIWLDSHCLTAFDWALTSNNVQYPTILILFRKLSPQSDGGENSSPIISCLLSREFGTNSLPDLNHLIALSDNKSLHMFVSADKEDHIPCFSLSQTSIHFSWS